MRRSRLPLLLAALGASACKCPGSDAVAKPTLEQLLAHPVRQHSFWTQSLAAPLIDRIGPAPAEVIDYVLADNAFNGYDDRPKSATAHPTFVADVRAAVESLHPKVRALIDRSTVAIGLVDGFGASAYTEGVFGDDGGTMGGFVLLDVTALERRANAWASWKESSPFIPAEGWKVEAQLEKIGDDTRVNAIRYILMHELGHVVDFARGINSFPGLSHEDPVGWGELSWQPAGEKRVRSRFDDAFPERAQIRYYAFERAGLSIKRAAETYAWLATTSFPTLYAATSPADDFAESFASYAHVVLDERPWRLVVRRGAKEETRYRPCWGKRRCAEKQKVMRRIFEESGE